MAKTRVLLIEDNRLLREGIAAILDGQGDFEVIAVAEDANDQPTADLLTQRLQIHEKTAWTLRSLMEA